MLFHRFHFIKIHQFQVIFVLRMRCDLSVISTFIWVRSTTLHNCMSISLNKQSLLLQMHFLWPKPLRLQSRQLITATNQSPNETQGYKGHLKKNPHSSYICKKLEIHYALVIFLHIIHAISRVEQGLCSIKWVIGSRQGIHSCKSIKVQAVVKGKLFSLFSFCSFKPIPSSRNAVAQSSLKGNSWEHLAPAFCLFVFIYFFSLIVYVFLHCSAH